MYAVQKVSNALEQDGELGRAVRNLKDTLI